MSDAHAIPLLVALRDFARSAERAGARIWLTSAPAETQELVRALFALPPRVTWDGTALEGALLLEVGERAAQALRLVRRRMRRKERHGYRAAPRLRRERA